MEKQISKFAYRACAMLVVLALCISLLPVTAQAEASEAIIEIRTAEEFMAIADNPSGSYRLEADIDLGSVTALRCGPYDIFDGVLDGNGHTVTYKISTENSVYVDETTIYALFIGMEAAEIKNLCLKPTIDITINDSGWYDISTFADWVVDTLITNVEIKGSISVSGNSDSSAVDVCGIGRLSGEAILQDCDVDLNVNISLPADCNVHYLGLENGERCSLTGNVRLEGAFNSARMLQDSSYSTCMLDLEVYSDGAGSITVISGSTDCTFKGNVYAENVMNVKGIYCSDWCSFTGDIVADGPEILVMGLQESNLCTFEGDISAKDTDGSSPYKGTVCGSVDGIENKVIGNLTATGGPDVDVLIITDYVKQYESNSYYEGTVHSDGWVFGLGDHCTAIANITAGGEVLLFQGTDSYFKGDISITAEDDPVVFDVFDYYNDRAQNCTADVHAVLTHTGTDGSTGPRVYAIGPNCQITGSIDVYYSYGSAAAHVEGDFPVTLHHPAFGSWSTENIPRTLMIHTFAGCTENCLPIVAIGGDVVDYPYYYHYDIGASVSHTSDWIPPTPDESPENFYLTAEIAEDDIFKYSVVCGTVMDQGEPVDSMTPVLSLGGDGAFSGLKMTVRLPEGFSFSPDVLDTTKEIKIGELSGSQTKNLPTIYPIYLSELDKQTAYCLELDFEGSCVTEAGSLVPFSQQILVDFFVPTEVTSTADSFAEVIKGAEAYTFSLDTAVGSGSVYNNETARLSAILATLAYKEDNLEELLVSELGFSNFTAFGEGGGVTDFDTRTVARFFATKRVICDGEIKNIIYVINRGTIVEEWLGNFNVGTLADHAGFAEAAEFVKNELTEYCKGLNKEDCLFLVTGHSRGAAVATIVGNWLNTKADLAEKEKISVYTFATPTVSKKIVNDGAGLTGNENIFNFVNYQDAIRNAASMQYYGRYGHTTYFAFDIAPDGATEHDDGYGIYALPHDGSSYTMSEIMNGILYEADTTSMASVSQALSRVTYFVTSLRSLYNRNAVDMGKELLSAHDMSLYYNAVVNQVEGSSVSEINARTKDAVNYLITSIEVRNAFIQEAGKTLVRTHIFKCPVNVYVRDAEGNIVASIVDKQVFCSDSNLQVTVCEDALMVACADYYLDDYTIQIEAYDDGAVTHSVYFTDLDGMEMLQQRKDIPVSNGEILTVNEYDQITDENETAEEAQSAYQTYEDAEEIKQVLDKLQYTPGDINGDGVVNNKDLTRLFQYLSDWDVEVVAAALDINGDGKVNNKDLTRLFQYLSNWDVEIF